MMTRAASRDVSFMQAFVALVLLFNFTLLLIGPSLIPGWVEPDDVLKQAAYTLATLAVGFYLGSSSGSKEKTAVVVEQQDKAIAALTELQALPTEDGVLSVKIKNTAADPAKTQEVGG